MEGQISCTGMHILLTLFISILASTSSDARRLLIVMESNGKEFLPIDIDESYGLSSPLSTAPPFCVYPPFMLPPPTTTAPPPPQSTTPLPPTFPTQPPPPMTTTPSPPLLFQPPVVHPPPHKRAPPPENAVWCVAKAHVPNPIIQEALDYACGSGADCDPINQNGSCFLPNTLLAHASFAFNSYWQRTKVAGGTCDFGGTAMLVTVDPSHNGCHFIYN